MTNHAAIGYLTPLAAGLDLADAEDRATFRQRVSYKTAPTSVECIREWCGSTAVRRYDATRDLVQFYIDNTK